MKEPTADQIVKDADRLLGERFGVRMADLKEAEDLRFRRKKPKIPAAYADTATTYQSPALEEEGRQIFALIDIEPIPHLIPPMPEDQPLTTKGEKFLMAAHEGLEQCYGKVRAKVSMSQIHTGLGVVKYPMKRGFYGKKPKPKGESPEELIAYNISVERYKKDQGIDDAFDYDHVPTDTVLYRGEPTNPLCVYEVREVDERDIELQDYKNTYPRGTAQGQDGSRTVRVIEYWDREWCKIVVDSRRTQYVAGKQTAISYEMDSWHHRWGEVPYAFAPAFENEVLSEEHRFASPLDALRAEIDLFNQLMTQLTNVGHLVGYPSWQKVHQQESVPSLDASMSKTNDKYRPGEIYDNDPGSEIKSLPMNTGTELKEMMLASERRMTRYSLSDIAKGVSPGADTANAAIAQLKRQLKSSLDPMVDNQAAMWRRMYQFMLKRIKAAEGEGIGETVYAYSIKDGDSLSLSPDEIVTVNLQVRQAPEAGTDLLIEEKQAAELTQVGLITPIEFHERRGKENPEEYVLAQTAWKLYQMMEPTVLQQVMAGLGDVNAQAQLIAANQQTGDASTAVPGIMEQLKARQNGQPPDTTGVMGSGSPGMPRDMGVRSSPTPTTTQPGAMMR